MSSDIRVVGIELDRMTKGCDCVKLSVVCVSLFVEAPAASASGLRESLLDSVVPRNGAGSMIYLRLIKRPVDILVSGFLIVCTSPVLVLCAGLVKLEDGGSVFYKQLRLGRFGKTIVVYKFRSMTLRPDRVPGESGELRGSHSEITRTGRWIRRWKLDELPQLFSVLRGDLSLIGPRPCLPEHAMQFDEYGKKRLMLRPGCTGLAQVNGNIHIEWTERWKFDAYYVEHVSFALDLRILLKTLLVILRGEEKFACRYDAFLKCSEGR